MPIKIERALMRAARKRGLNGKRRNAYVYGTLNRIEKQNAGRGRIRKK